MTKKNWLLASSVLAAAGACSLANVPEDPLAPPGGGGTGASSSSSSSSSSSETCDPQKCSGVDKTCRYRACIEGECGFENAPAGTACEDGGACDGEGKCVPASCSDGKPNGGETDTDCGGPCPPCPNDRQCQVPADCESGFCDSGVCQPCESPDDCGAGLYCNEAQTCAPLKPNGDTCADVAQCQSGFCVDAVCCESVCEGLCMTCVSQSGKCTAQQVGTDPDLECPSPKTCDGKGGCACIGTTTYFVDDFSDKAAGWIFGGPPVPPPVTEWEIGPAKASSGQNFGNPDPGTDHSPNNVDPNNGVAGVVIGGNARTQVHSYEYLESAIFNTSGNTGQVFLSYWRWLNSDYSVLPNEDFMQNVVQVYDGNGWVTLWESGGKPGVTENQWQQQTVDITKFRSTGTRIRFGHRVGKTGVMIVSSWNIDDVLVASCIP